MDGAQTNLLYNYYVITKRSALNTLSWFKRGQCWHRWHAWSVWHVLPYMLHHAACCTKQHTSWAKQWVRFAETLASCKQQSLSLSQLTKASQALRGAGNVWHARSTLLKNPPCAFSHVRQCKLHSCTITGKMPPTMHIPKHSMHCIFTNIDPQNHPM